MTEQPAPRQSDTTPSPERTAPAVEGEAGSPLLSADVRIPPARQDSIPGVSGSRAFDVAVVGAGIGGLAVAALLARAGRSVVVLDRSGEAGGTCRRLISGGYQFDLGTTLLTGFGPRGALTTLLERLSIDLPRTASDPTFQAALPRHRLTFYRDPERWWPEIRREVPEDEAGWRSLVTEFASLVSDRDQIIQVFPTLPPDGWWGRLGLWKNLARRGLSSTTRQAAGRLRKAERTPLRATLARVGLGAVSRQALEAMLWYLLLREADECSTLEAAVALQCLSEGAVEIPEGPTALARALGERIQRNGGEVRLETEVSECLVERGRVSGLVTKAGERIRSRFVVTDVSPAVLTQGILPERHGWLSRRLPVEGPWQPLAAAQVMVLVVPESFLPSELGSHCLVVRDAGRPAAGENLGFVRLGPKGQLPDGLRCLSVGRFVPPSAPADPEAVTQALLAAVEEIAPGIGRAAAYQAVIPSATLGEFFGRPLTSVRYAMDSPRWLGRRGLSHQTGRPGLLTVGEWTYPGRLISDVVEGAIEVADGISMTE